MYKYNQTGIIQLPLILVAIVGVLAFLLISSTAPFKDKLLSSLFPKPASFAANSGTVVVNGNLVLTATFNSIGVELKNTTATSGDLKYRIAGGIWKTTLPLWQAGGALYGSVVLAQPGTSYEVSVTPVGGAAVSATITTRAENIPPASSLTPSHYVSASGNDANNGSSSAPWKTLGKAAEAAPANAVVQVGPGSYTARNLNNTDKVQFTRPITLVAQFPALDDQRNETNTRQHSIIESGNFTSPGGSSWTSKVVAGCTFYQWNSGVNDTFNLGYASTKDELPKRIAKWDRKGSANTTVDNFLSLMCTNKTYNYGFIADGTTIYARLPNDINPNAVYVSTNTGLVNLHGPNIRISGFELRQASFETDAAASFAILDHNLIGMGNFYMPAARDGQTNPPTLYYGGDHVVQYNKVMEYGTWSDDPNNKAINWTFIKGYIIKADGSTYDVNRLGANSEGSGLMGGAGGAKRVVLRYNTLDGGFNGVTYYNADYDKYATQDQDIHDNLIKHVADDAFEPEQFAINWRIWNNRIENSGVILSTGPVKYGPIYLFRNQGYKIGWYQGGDGLASLFFKFSGSSNPTARIFAVNNTFWTDIGYDGGNQFAGGGETTESFYLRNNIFHAQRYAFQYKYNPYPDSINPNKIDKWDETNNYFSTSNLDPLNPPKGLEVLGRHDVNVNNYRNAYNSNPYNISVGKTTNSNVGWNSQTGDGNFITDPGKWFTNVLAGDLTLKTNSPFIDTGAVVPNIAECFAGSAPDLGAFESGTPTTCTTVAVTATTPPATQAPGATATPIPAGGSSLNGLSGKYFNGNWWDSPVVLTRTDPDINFSWLSGSPDPSINADGFSATWDGYIQAPATGTYTFYVSADDGAQLMINNQVVVERLVYGNNELTGTINLTAGQKYPIFVGFLEGNGGASLNLSWSYGTQTKQIIPSTSFFTTIISPTPSVSLIAGDIDRNNKVDISDFNQLLTDFGKTGTGIVGDINPPGAPDGKVDIYDYNLLLTNFGK